MQPRAFNKKLPVQNWGQYFADLSFGFENLLLHKLRSLLTMLGMIFGVAAVIAMLSIGAGARQLLQSAKQCFGNLAELVHRRLLLPISFGTH